MLPTIKKSFSSHGSSSSFIISNYIDEQDEEDGTEIAMTKLVDHCASQAIKHEYWIILSSERPSGILTLFQTGYRCSWNDLLETLLATFSRAFPYLKIFALKNAWTNGVYNL